MTERHSAKRRLGARPPDPARLRSHPSRGGRASHPASSLGPGREDRRPLDHGSWRGGDPPDRGGDPQAHAGARLLILTGAGVRAVAL